VKRLGGFPPGLFFLSDPTAPRVVPGLDGLRGLAILLVVLWHCAPPGTAVPAWIGPLAAHGWAGVDLFFALSGLVQLLLHGREP